jgi:DNA-binding CsgD family transcriptional regulator
VEIAHHHFLGGDLARAAGPCEAAGTLARAQFAYDECIRWYERALVAYGSDGAAAARVRLELGKVLVYAHELERGIAEYEAVAAWARTHDPVLFVRARKLIAGTIAADGRREAAIALLEATLATLGGQHAALGRELALRIASFVLLRDDPSDARATLALLEPAELGLEARAEFYRLRSDMHAHEPADDAEWRRDAARAIELYERSGSTRFEHYTRVQFGWQALARGDVASARTSLETAERRSNESASTSNHLPISFAFVECAAGRFDAARAWLARVTTSQQLIERALEAVVRTELALALDDVAELERRIELALIGELERADEARGAFRLGTAFGCALLRLDKRPEADRLFERVAPLARTTYEIVPGALALSAVRPDLTNPFLALLERGHSTPFLAAAAALVRAEVERSAGRPCDVASLRDARAFYELAGWPALAARAAELEGDRAGAAQLYRAIGHVAGVRRLGLAAFRTAGSPALAGDIESELSARELEVARCIASGASNREAAATLSLSIKTIEKHLSSIYLKLGLHSRAQLAAYVAGARVTRRDVTL